MSNTEDMVDDNTDTSWQHNAITSRDTKVKGIIHVSLDKFREVNRIKLVPHTPKNPEIIVEHSPDGGSNWIELIRESHHVIDFDIDSKDIKDLRITIIKEEADTKESSDEGDVNFLHSFGIQELSLFKVDYSDTNMLYSEEFSLPSDKMFSKLGIWVDEEIYTGTDIRYHVDIDGDWVELVPLNRDERGNKYIYIGNVMDREPAKLSMSENREPGELEIPELRTRGSRFYVLGYIDDDIMKDSIEIYKGSNSWMLEAYEGNIIGDESPQTLGKVVEDINPDKLEPESIREGDSGLLLNNHSDFMLDGEQTYRFSARFYSNVDKSIVKTPMSNTNIAIYLNNSKIYKGIPRPGTQVSFNIKKGWNTIDTFIHIPKDVNQVTTDIELDIEDIATHIYSTRYPMEKVTLFDLRYNTKPDDDTRYAIRDTERGVQIILNHAPLGIPHEVFYLPYDEQIENIRLSAELISNRDISEKSPKLNSYQIRFI